MNIICLVMFVAIIVLILALLKTNAMLKDERKTSSFHMDRYFKTCEMWEKCDTERKYLENKLDDIFASEKFRIYLYDMEDCDYIECAGYRYDSAGNFIVYELGNDRKEYYIRNIKGFRSTRVIFKEAEIENVKVEDAK